MNTSRITLCCVAVASLLLFPACAAEAVPPQIKPYAHGVLGTWPKYPRGEPFKTTLAGNYAYVAQGSWGMAIIDVSNPTNIFRVGGYNRNGVGEVVQVTGNSAYLLDWKEGLMVLDVSNPAKCAFVRQYAYSNYYLMQEIKLAGNYAYVAEGINGFSVLDVSNPDHCVRVGGYNTGYNTYNVAMLGNYAYVLDQDSGMHIIDVSKPANCGRVGGYRDPFSSPSAPAPQVLAPDPHRMRRVTDIDHLQARIPI